ncbi:hypothetical protein [Taklimakanibacter deserti]|uniref:hypothetical protein n=1 Tax=Taklimakanibacter deserti TaxID=2267839 RepID=UPI000E659383
MTHVPTFNSQQESERIYIVCGRIAIYWGPVELSVEGVLTKLRNNLRYGQTPGSFLWSIPFPKQFGRKVEEIKLHLKSSPKYANVRSEAAPLLIRCYNAFQVRNHVVHSVCQGTDSKGRVIFGTSDHKKGKSYVEVRLSPKQLENAAVAMLRLVDELKKLHDQLHNPALR